MDVVALGTSGSYAKYGEACSGYLFRSGTTNVLVDIGNGVLANLFRYLDPHELDAIVVTHLHADHVADLFPLGLYLRWNPRPGKDLLEVHAPEGSCALLESFQPWAGPGELSRVFRFVDLPAPFTAGPMSFRFVPTRHLIPTFALVCQEGDRRIGFSADTSWDEGLPAAFEGCDALLCEATYQGPKGIDRVHLSACEAGRMAARAKVPRLVLTHLWPESDPGTTMAEAAGEFAGTLERISAHGRIVV